MPLFKFLRLEIWRWNLWFDESKRLKYKCTIFYLRCYECSWCNYECRMTKMICFEREGIPEFVEERDPTPLGDTVVSLGKMIAYYRVDSSMKRKTRSWMNIGKFWNVFVNWWFVETNILIGDISGQDTLGITSLTFRHPTNGEWHLRRKLSDVSSSDISGDEIVDTPSSAKTGNDNFDINAKNLSDTLFLIK